jgi:Putative Actinobacterial Holin-X, holin superfamily III
MSVEKAELPDEEAERGWRGRLREVSSAGRTLVSTRLAIFEEEVAAKALLAARGVAAIVVGAVLGVGALLLGAALLAAVLTRLTNSVVLGILLAVILYVAGAAAAAWLGVRWISRVRPFEFPAVSAELSRDFEAIAEALAPSPELPLDEAVSPASGEAQAVADLEDRFRRQSE